MLLDKIELTFLGACFLAAGLGFYRNFRAAPSGVLRQQFKWLTGGTLAGTVPFTVLYIVPFVMDLGPRGWMQFSAVSLVLIPLCFGYAVIRYRLMDVDIIFKRGLAYTAATAGVAAVYFALVALLAQIFHAQTTGTGRRHDRHSYRGVSVSAVPRMDAVQVGQILLSRPARLSQDAD